MKSLRIAVAALAALSLTACSFVIDGKTLKGEGSRVTKDTVTADFERISAAQAIQVVYVQRPGRPQVRVEAYENVMPRLEISVEGSTLHLGYDSSVGGVSDVQTVVTVYAPSVSGIEASSAARVETDSLVLADGLEIDASSAAMVSLRGLSVKAVAADASSAAAVVLAGTCGTVDFDASSAAKINATALKAASGRAEASSAAHVETCVSGHLRSGSSSAGSVSNTTE